MKLKRQISAFLQVIAFFFCSAAIAPAQKLNTDYPEIRLAKGTVLSEARVASFDKKNLTFCIAHRHGIEACVPWGAMPVIWQAAFPLEGPDVQRGAEQVAAAKKAPPTNASQNGEEGKTVVRRSDSRQESNPSTSRKDRDLETLDVATEIEDRRLVVRHYLDNRANGLSQEESKRRAVNSAEDDRAKLSPASTPAGLTMHRSW